MGIFDTHAHYLREDFGDGLDGLLAGMPEMGVEKIMAVGYDLASSEEEAGAIVLLRLLREFTRRTSRGCLTTGCSRWKVCWRGRKSPRWGR